MLFTSIQPEHGGIHLFNSITSSTTIRYINWRLHLPISCFYRVW